MGRAFLSAKFETETRPVTPIIAHPPKYVDAPFDLDSDSDADDVVYEAFCTFEEYKERTEHRAMSPGSSTGSSVHESVVQNLRPSPSAPATLARRRLSDDGQVATGSPLNLARLVADMRPILSLPQVRDAMPDSDILTSMRSSESRDDIHRRVLRIRRAMRPHINAYLQPLPGAGVEVVSSLLERALVVDALGGRGLEYSEAISRLGEQEGLDRLDDSAEVSSLEGASEPTHNQSSTAPEPADGSEPVPLPTQSITINASRWWQAQSEQETEWALPRVIRAEFAPTLDTSPMPTSSALPALAQNYLVEDAADTESSTGSRSTTPSDDVDYLLASSNGETATTANPRSTIPSSGEMFAAFREMVAGDTTSGVFPVANRYDHPLFAAPLR